MSDVVLEASRRRASIRCRADQFMMRRPYVCGVAYGTKRTDGKLTGDPCYTVYVTTKVASHRLTKTERIPKSVIRSGIVLPTDVVELGPLAPQSALSAARPLFIRDNLTSGGTATCFVRIRDDFYVLSCAHVVWGTDKNPDTPDPIEVYDPVERRWEPLGETVAGLREQGFGYAPDFGYLDAGLVSISTRSLRRRVTTEGRPWNVYPSLECDVDLSELQDQHVHAQSLVSARQGETYQTLNALVTGVYFVHSSGRRFDLVIEKPDQTPMTYPGDSGMLWRNSQDRALAMHIFGVETATDRGSRFSFATFMYRILKRFNAVALR